MSTGPAEPALRLPAGARGAPSRWLPPALWSGAGLAMATLAALAGFLLLGMGTGSLDVWQLLTDATWDPSREHFGAAAMIWGSAAVATLALVLAAAVGWAAAVAINELCSDRWRGRLRAGSELLAVVPSIVYGLMGIAYVRPLVAEVTGAPGGDSLLAAAIVLAAMVLPTIVAVSVDALSRVPMDAREAAAALGLTRTEVIRRAVLPQAAPGLVAAALLGLARALGETIAVFLLVGRADGRLPSIDGVFRALGQPGQTLTTKLNGPETLLAGTHGPHWAALCALGLLLLIAVGALTFLALRSARASGSLWRKRMRRRGRLRPAWRGRATRDRVVRFVLEAAMVVPPALFVAIVAVVVVKGSDVFDPAFWLRPSAGASGGGIRDQVVGTVLMVAVAGAVAAPVGLGLGIVASEYGGRRVARWLRVATVTLAGTPSIVLGLFGYFFFSITLGWGKSWLAGSLLLAVLVIPVVALSVAAAADALPAERREAACALGLERCQLVRSVIVPHTSPALLTGLLLGLARAAGETAPLLFTATVFFGAPAVPAGVAESPVQSLPTHIFNLAQDNGDAAALRSAWGAAGALIAMAGALVLGALLTRRRTQRTVA